MPTQRHTLKRVEMPGASAGGPAPVSGDSADAAVPLLFERYGRRLYGLALRLCGNASDAEDMVQDVFLKAYRKWHTFRGEADPGTWLYSIAARTCKARHRRKGGIDRRMPAVSQLMPWNETTVMRAAVQESPDDEAQRHEAVSRVQAEIAKLPEHFRLPVVVREVMGLSVEETAGALGLTVNTVKTRLHRARLALRKAMTAKSTKAAAPQPVFEKQVCLDLLKAKMEAMDRGGSAAGFGVPQAEVCARCSAVFRELDIVQEACAGFGSGTMPQRVRERVLAALREREAHETPPRRAGRKPVRAGRQGQSAKPVPQR
ncbi:MAG: RNA polymerase sigma factor [Phycisphaeraceae bacterium]|nr:RNA polymerase sigma factor [Phycisphaeraceae bacterium]